VAYKKRLKESEQRFRFMLNAIPQQVWTAQPNGALDYLIDNVVGDFGRSGEEIVGDGWQAFIHPEDLPRAIKVWKTSLDSGNEYQVEFRLKFKDGEYHWHLARALPLIEDGDIKLGLEQILILSSKRIMSIKRMNFYHSQPQLRTPLTSIKAYSDLMRRTQDVKKCTGLLKSPHTIYSD
jgi:PAS domain S-box-containing protein